MKITFDIDCTPAEARAFLGLPDVTPLHDAWLDRMKALMTDGPSPADLSNLTRLWSAGMPGMEQFEKLQQLFWQAATQPKS